jgi:DNA-binding NarL/FixJ family response regulator
MDTNKRIVIVDDHTLFRKGLKAIIGTNNGFEVTGEAGNAADGLLLAGETKPDIMIIDITLPDKDGIKLTREVRHNFPEIRVMIVSMHSKTDYILEAFRSGALSYIVKDSATENLISGLHSVSKGVHYIDNSIAKEVIFGLQDADYKKKKKEDAYGCLTNREQQVFRLLVEGVLVKEIAEKLFISPKTVENHRGNIMKKLNIHSTVELIRYAVDVGLVERNPAAN